MKELLTGEIRKLESFSDFKKVFHAYSSFPYYEEWSEDEIREEYETNLKDGHIFGYFYNNECVGLVTVVNATTKDHPIHFAEPDKALYISNLIVMLEYRYHGFGTQISEFAVNFAKENGYKNIYFRYRESHEFGRRIAKKLGFSKCHDICQEVTRARTSKFSVRNDNADLRFFMVKSL